MKQRRVKQHKYSIAAFRPINIEVVARNQVEAVQKAKAWAKTGQGGEEVDADGCDYLVRPGKHGVCQLEYDVDTDGHPLNPDGTRA